MKAYQLKETKTIASYQDKSEAIADRDNFSLWNPDREYWVESDLEDGVQRFMDNIYRFEDYLTQYIDAHEHSDSTRMQHNLGSLIDVRCHLRDLIDLVRLAEEN